MIEDDLRRSAKLLESLVRMAGMSARQLEEKLGYGAGTMHRIFNGRIELKLRHILLILEAVGIPPSQFFREAFPEDERPRSETETAARLYDLLEQYVPRRPVRPKPVEPVRDDDLDRRIVETLSRLGILPRPEAEPAVQPRPGRRGRRS